MCGRFAQIREEEELMKSLYVHHCEAVSYTHLTLPTIYSV